MGHYTLPPSPQKRSLYTLFLPKLGANEEKKIFSIGIYFYRKRKGCVCGGGSHFLVFLQKLGYWDVFSRIDYSTLHSCINSHVYLSLFLLGSQSSLLTCKKLLHYSFMVMLFKKSPPGDFQPEPVFNLLSDSVYHYLSHKLLTTQKSGLPPQLSLCLAHHPRRAHTLLPLILQNPQKASARLHFLTLLHPL